MVGGAELKSTSISVFHQGLEAGMEPAGMEPTPEER